VKRVHLRRVADILRKRNLNEADDDERHAQPNLLPVAAPADQGGEERQQLEADDDAAERHVRIERVDGAEDVGGNQVHLCEDEPDHGGGCERMGEARSLLDPLHLFSLRHAHQDGCGDPLPDEALLQVIVERFREAGIGKLQERLRGIASCAL